MQSIQIAARQLNRWVQRYSCGEDREIAGRDWVAKSISLLPIKKQKRRMLFLEGTKSLKLEKEG